MTIHAQRTHNGKVSIFHDGAEIRNGLTDEEALSFLDGADFCCSDGEPHVVAIGEIIDADGRDKRGSRVMGKVK